MNPVPLFLIIVTLPLLLGGCGEKLEVTDETKPKLKSVNYGELEQRESIWYLKGLDTPYIGKSFRLYDNGQKATEVNWKDGKQDGLFVQWNEVGQKEAEINFKDGKENGLWTRWHNNGQKEQEIYFKDGKEDGLWIEWDKNGQKSSEANYKNGKGHGLAVIWHQNGQKKSEENWKEGKMIYEKFWNSKGEPVESFKEAQK